MSDERADRGVDIELLAAEIDALRGAATRYTRAVDADQGVGGAGLDLENAALRYVRKLDEEQRKARGIDYAAIIADAERAQNKLGN